MKWLVQARGYRTAVLVKKFSIGQREYVRVRFTNLTYPRFYGYDPDDHVERNIRMSEVVRIYRVKTKIEKWFIRQIKKLRR